MREYEIDRIKASLEQLQKEYEQLRFTLIRVKRDEQFEIERVRRDFAHKINVMEERQELILREQQAKKQDLKRLELRAREDAGPQTTTSSISDDKARRLGRIR